MKIVKFLKRKSYGQTTHKVGESIPMREDHANLLQYMGIVVIEDSPVMKLPIPSVQGSILTSTPEKEQDPPATPPKIPPAGDAPGENEKSELTAESEAGEGTSSEPLNEPAGAETETGSDPKSNKESAKNRKQKAGAKANENKNAD
jgi:hypothetical protein